MAKQTLLLLLLAVASTTVSAFSSVPFLSRVNAKPNRITAFVSTEDNAAPEAAAPTTPPPILNGKMVLPMKVLMSGLSGHSIAAVYAVLNSGYKRGSGDGWPQCQFVGVTKDLDAALKAHLQDQGSDKVANVRALSFSFPQEGAMDQVALEWKAQAEAAGAKLRDWTTPELRQAQIAAMEATAFYDDDDDDDDEWELDDVDVMPPASEQVVSPFEQSAAHAYGNGQQLPFTPENVDKVLEEVRPYLISDGGNVSVQKVEPESKKIFLKLEGACGSCPSSTVTMSMGIERVLKENFGPIEVVQVEDGEDDKPTELTLQAIQQEVTRISPAIVAMGGVIDIVSVDPIGEVTINFRGANKVQQGLEMALLDVPYCKSVKFVSQDRK